MARTMHHAVPKLRARDGDDCMICHEPLDFTVKVPHSLAVTVDHVIPRSLGGPNALRNLRLAHYRCNNDRGAGWNSRRRKHKVPRDVGGEPGDVPVAVCGP